MSEKDPRARGMIAPIPSAEDTMAPSTSVPAPRISTRFPPS